jgi:PKD repeat protein
MSAHRQPTPNPLLTLLLLASCTPSDDPTPADTDVASAVAVLAASPTSGVLPLHVTFNTEGSTLSAGSADWQFDYGDGQTGTDSEHTYWASGTFKASITVTNLLGETDKDRAKVTVDPLPCPTTGEAESLGNTQSPELNEASGLVVSQLNPGVLWTHNDAGDNPRLFALANDGAHLGVLTLSDLPRSDWEDLALGEDPTTGNPRLYIGDLGDNSHSRLSVAIHFLDEPVVADGVRFDETHTPATMHLRYPQGVSHDAETLMVDPSTQDLYIVTKDRQGPTLVFLKAAPHVDDENAYLQPIASYDSLAGLPSGTVATSGSISRDGLAILVRTYRNQALVWTRDGLDLADAFATEPCLVSLPNSPQGESVAFSPDGTSVWTVSEGLNQPLRRTPFSF